MQNNERVVKRHDREANNYNSRNVRGINVAYMFKIPARISKWTSERSDETGRESERERERERGPGFLKRAGQLRENTAMRLRTPFFNYVETRLNADARSL